MDEANDPMGSSPFAAFRREQVDGLDSANKQSASEPKEERGRTTRGPILPAEILPQLEENFCYVGDSKCFCEKRQDEFWDEIQREDLLLRLKDRFSLNARPESSSTISEVQKAQMYIHDNCHCDCSLTSLAGYRAGLHRIGGERVLLKRHLSIMEPKEGSCAMLQDLMLHMFGPDQLPYLLTWWQHAYANAHAIYREGKDIAEVCSEGLALILCGPPQVGKTFLIGLINRTLGGVFGKPFGAMTGKTLFNGDCARAIHLSNDDETGTRTYEERKAYGQRLKAMISGEAKWIRMLYKDAITAPLFQRITYTLNDDRDSFSTFPAISKGVRERVLALLVNATKWPRFASAISREEHNTLSSLLCGELPAQVYHLLHEFQPPRHCLGSSFGCREFIHPDIERKVEQATPEATLKGMIFDVLRTPFRPMGAETPYDFLGEARTLFEALQNSIHRDGLWMQTKNVVSFGMKLKDLCQDYPKHFRCTEQRVNNNFQYEISISGFPDSPPAAVEEKILPSG
jgi:hypothetical protein